MNDDTLTFENNDDGQLVPVFESAKGISFKDAPSKIHITREAREAFKHAATTTIHQPQRKCYICAGDADYEVDGQYRCGQHTHDLWDWHTAVSL